MEEDLSLLSDLERIEINIEVHILIEYARRQRLWCDFANERHAIRWNMERTMPRTNAY